MLDLELIRKDPEHVKASLQRKEFQVDFTELLSWDEQRRKLITETETLKARRNKVSSEIPQLKKQGQDTQPLMAEMREVGEKIAALDAELAQIEDRVRGFLERLPNLPDDDVIPGGKEHNLVVRTFGSKPEFAFQPKHHVDLVNSLGLIDYERGVKLGGNNFWIYTGDGARLEWALLNFFIEEHLKDGYEFILPPHILNYECGYTAGQFPKFTDDVFSLVQPDGAIGKQFLLPTAETALVNLYRDEILDEEELPRKFFSYTPCYRKEAGSHGAQERGMIRGHQFNKVELFQYTRPEDSNPALDEMIGKAERIVQALGLHFRTSKLAAGDCTSSMAKTFDIEIWIPSMNEYKEVSSASNAKDYQARRGSMRFRRKGSKKPEFMHTLNASGLATSRIFPAMLEQLQQADGSVVVPEVLRKWIGKDRFFPKTKTR